VDILHLNADFAYPLTVDFNQVHHASDHEPVQVRFRPGGAAMVGGNLLYPGLPIALLDEAQRPLGTTLTDALGDFRFWNLRPGTVTLHVDAPQSLALPPQDMTLSLQPGYNSVGAPVSEHRAAAVGGAAAWIGGELARTLTARR
jgi:hypothetical protein